MVTLKQTEKYYRRKGRIPGIVFRNIEPKEIIYGSHALNVQLPKFLRKPAGDWDIFAKQPKKEARQIEKALDKSFKGNFFSLQKAQHPGTWKVKDIFGNEIVDYTKLGKRTPSKIIKKKRYVPLSYIKKNIKQTLKQKKSKYRWNKDREALQRILVFEGLKKI